MGSKTLLQHWKLETILAQSGGFLDEVTGAIVPPIHPSSTYARDASNQLISGRLYSRADNPNYDLPEQLIAQMEGGEEAALFSSGNAAGSMVFQAWLRPGDHVLIPEVMYWALRSWMLDWAQTWGVELEVVDMTQVELVRKAIRVGKTRLIWLESPANPNLAITDLSAIIALAREFGVKVGVDSTFATPILTRPLELGADLVLHSATKYLNGHSDVIAGVLVTREANEDWEKIKKLRFSAGAVLGPFEAWLLLRGMRTMSLRVQAQSANALKIAQHFEGHPRVERVLYPGLPSFEGHEIARRQMVGGFGGMMSIQVLGGAKEALHVISRLQIWKRATSLGGVESLIEHRASVEGPLSPTPPNLLRMSVGIEAASDLIDDLDSALRE